MRTPHLARRWSRWAIPAVVWLTSVTYVGSRIDRDWAPHDEGLLGQTAERLLRGQLPHRDFDDPYTGLLTAYHAVALALGGHNLLSLRWALLLALAVWVPAMYAIATRFLSPLAAGLATLVAVAWSVPNYPASTPSWYNLFLATACALGVIRYMETSRRGWLVTAGVFAGLSVIVKIDGVYTVGAVVLFLVWRALDFNRLGRASFESSRTTGVSIEDLCGNGHATRSGIIAAGLLALVLVAVVRTLLLDEPGPGRVQQFIIPATAIGIVLVAALARARRVPWRLLAAEVGTFAFGVAVPVAVFLVPYVWTRSLRDLVIGVLARPARRLADVAQRPPGGWHWAYLTIFQSMRATVPLASSALAITLILRPTAGSSLIGRHYAVLLVFMAVCFSFIQFPFSAAVYFCYVAPLALLAVLSLAPGLWGPGVQAPS